MTIEIRPIINNVLNAELSIDVHPISIELDVEIGATVEFDYYDGEYEFIPTQEEQVVETQNFILLDNIVVKPIPQNYGLITYNGFEITVS